ncbi:hypothetical protein TSTA_117890 [Talaromyces stipitatus ATCC 10500]|uniref:Uncharacterized protein n=1 Tax=Talaromyces stipitatus (strain ATCC 10500 / CBS 375.48 / QM 6759 / NRRL 1006) TaxID=441959 RepID=B8M9L5_TALSN|nr:uncharacterized protein TSTA_117890 [Talaromyces stipitatus ATCC 10500]EED18017.1 hypothetical protein TSTA_117890 [Talaromyces stipitatus ATCC 10500]
MQDRRFLEDNAFTMHDNAALEMVSIIYNSVHPLIEDVLDEVLVQYAKKKVDYLRLAKRMLVCLEKKCRSREVEDASNERHEGFMVHIEPEESRAF